MVDRYPGESRKVQSGVVYVSGVPCCWVCGYKLKYRRQRLGDEDPWVEFRYRGQYFHATCALKGKSRWDTVRDSLAGNGGQVGTGGRDLPSSMGSTLVPSGCARQVWTKPDGSNLPDL